MTKILELHLKEVNVAAQNKSSLNFIKVLMFVVSFSCNNLYANSEISKVQEIVIVSPALKASSVALQDFERFLAVSYVRQNDINIFLSDIRNYEVKIFDSGMTYKITFLPNKFKSQYLKGGGAMYEVNKISFIVTQKQYFE